MCVSPSNWQLWRIDPSTAPLRLTYSHVAPVLLTWHPDDGCGLLLHIVWTFRPFVFIYSRQAGVSGFWCHCLERPASTSHLRHHSRFSDDSIPFCFPVPTKTLSYNFCVTSTIHHYCLDTCGLVVINIIQGTLQMFMMMMLMLINNDNSVNVSVYINFNLCSALPPIMRSVHRVLLKQMFLQQSTQSWWRWGPDREDRCSASSRLSDPPLAKHDGRACPSDSSWIGSSFWFLRWLRFFK